MTSFNVQHDGAPTARRSERSGSGERFEEHGESFRLGCAVETTIPRCEPETAMLEDQSCGEVDGVESVQIVVQRERGDALDERLVQFDDSERRPTR
jgi:hypothetical protein